MIEGVDMKSHILKSTIFVFCLLVLTMSLSYSFYTYQVTNVNDIRETQVDTGQIDVDFATTEYINNLNIMLIKDEEAPTKAEHTDFTVSHTSSSNLDFYYFVSLTDLTISENFKSPDFKWSLLRNGSEVANGNFANVGDSPTLLLTENGLLLNVGESDSLVLRVWLSETDVDQSSLYNGSFTAKVQVTTKR